MIIEGIPFELPDELTDQQKQFMENYARFRNAHDAAVATWGGAGYTRYRGSRRLVRIVQRIEVPQTYKAQSLEWQVEQLVAVAEGKKNGSARVQAIKALREILNDPEEPRTWRKKEALEMKKKMPEALADRLKEADDGYKN